MAEIEDVVRAEIQLRAARSSLALADLEERQRQTIMTTSNSNVRLSLGRKIRRATAISDSWQLVIALMDAEDLASEVAVIGELVAPPERTVAWQVSADGDLWCNRNSQCREGATEGRPIAAENLTRLTTADLPDGGVCAVCGTDVLA